MKRHGSARALVIGSEGNIGAPLVSYLRTLGYVVLECDIRPGLRPNYLVADINQPLDLLPAFDWSPDVVFLMAAVVGRTTAEQASSLAIATNVGGVNNVLQLCKWAESTCVYISTSEIYGPTSVSMDETATPQPGNRYGLSKWLAEQLVEYEVRTCGLRAVILRPCMVYDEMEVVGEHRSAMIRFASRLARGQPIEVHRGTARSWLHISDAVRAIEAAAHVEADTAINIGHPETVPMIDLAEMIRHELQADPSLIRTVPLPPQITAIKQPSLDRQRLLLGFEPSVDLRQGVRMVCSVQRKLAASSTRSAVDGSDISAGPSELRQASATG
jgi:nucleoside-diphosphate-sugar epimerase